MCYFFKKVTTFCWLYIVGIYKIFNLGLCAVFLIWQALTTWQQKIIQCSTHTKDFCEKNTLKLPGFEGVFFEIMFGRYVS